MKLRSTTPRLKQFMTRTMLVSAALMMVFQLTRPVEVSASTIDEQINALQNEINSYQSRAAELQGQAVTLQNAIAQLEAQMGAIQAKIELNKAKETQLNADIEANTQKLERQKVTLSRTVAQMYVTGETTPIEVLAGSDSIGQFISAQQVQSSVRNQLKASVDAIKTLKAQLDQQKAEVVAVLKDQENQNAQLAAKRSEQAGILAQTQGEEASYQKLIGEKSSQLAAKRAEQAAAMARANAGSNIVYGASSYPWMNSSMQYDDYCRYYSGGSAADPWGYCKRQCVSYVAWKLNTDGRGNTGYSGLGNANGWGYGGYGVGWGSLQPGDVIVWYIGSYGHVMYVEWTDGSQVGVSQMNVPYDSGAYSTKTYDMSTLQNGAYEARRFH